MRFCLPVFVGLIAGVSDGVRADDFDETLAPAFRESCVRCHGEKGKVKGKVNLLEMTSMEDLAHDLERLRDLIGVLEDQEMPPEEEPPLAPDVRDGMVAQLKQLLRETVSARKALPPTPLSRKNRFQYNNEVQDLFDLKVEVFALPERMLRDYGYFRPETGEMPATLKAGNRPLGKSQLIERRLAGVAPFPQDLRAEHGYDNQADHLSLSPLLLESFLKLSRSIVESEDFSRQTCGIWDAFFAPPGAGEDVATAVRERLRVFLTRAFRRPADEATLDRYAAHVLALTQADVPFTEAMKEAASAVLASPKFLYLYDRAASDAPDDLELASRLSFFLWGSIPDATLLDLAVAGKLRDPTELGRQVDRMLNDRRLKRFCDSFPGQWLQLDRLISSAPDPEMFPEFYFLKYRSSMHMMLEPLLLFETILVEDRPILELIDARFSYRSALLDAWYEDGKKAGNAPPTAIPFRRVPVNDRRQGGVITNAAVMTMTSGATRTKPITRGAWMASVIFNDPPEPPPGDVPPLPEGDEVEKLGLTLRERLDMHRERADCAGCHAQIDPLGFALENYGPTGRWRDKYENGRDIDSGGELFRRHRFASVVEFKDAILLEKERFVRAFAGHLLAFALGRETTAADSLALDAIVRESAEAGFRMRPLVRQIVLSEPFLHRSNPDRPEKP